MDGNWGAVIAAFAALSGILLGWMGRARDSRKDDKSDAAASATLRADVDYIKRGVDDIRLEQKAQATDISSLCERVAKVEESAKSAHHRLDDILDKKN